MSVETLIEELKVKIIETLDLPDITPGDMDKDARLVGGPSGIDSIDVLEMVMMIEKEYGIRIDNQELGKAVFTTLETLAEYIDENLPEHAR
jgi:acyl carrier protein